MLSSKTLKDIVSEARPIIERQLDDAERIAAFREVVSSNGGDWSALKALIKAHIQDERDETGDGKRVKKILEKAGFSTGYAGMLGWSNMNEKNFSADEEFDATTGEFLNDNEASDGSPSVSATLAARVAEESAVSHSPETATEREAVANQGEATVSTQPTNVSLPADGESSEGANAGGDDVDGGAERAEQEPTSKTGEGAASALPAKPKFRLRPNCLDRSNCKSGSVDHCWSCKKAMAEKSEVAA